MLAAPVGGVQEPVTPGPPTPLHQTPDRRSCHPLPATTQLRMIPRRFGEPGCTMTAFDARYFCAMLADRFCKHVAYNCVGEQHRQDMMRQALHEKECPFQPALPSRRSYTGRRGLRDNDKGRRYERLWVPQRQSMPATHLPS